MNLIDISIKAAIEAATKCGNSDLPIGASLVDENGGVLGVACNQVGNTDAPSRHAELIVLDQVGTMRLKEFRGTLTMATTLEPCPMCAWAIRSVHIRTLVYGARNPVYGAAGSALDLLLDTRFGSQVEVIGGILEDQCQNLLADSFLRLRDNSQW